MIVRILMALIIMGALHACKKEPNTITPPATSSQGLYVLNEGLFNMNNSTLTRYDFATNTAFTDYFAYKNGRGLGDTGNDMALYGSKLYILTTTSSQLEVLDAATGESLAQIPLFDNNKARQPRNLSFLGDRVFIACFDGKVLAIDTTDYHIRSVGQAGSNPDGIVPTNNKLYVSNSGGLNFPHYDSTVSVLEPHNLTEITRITVGINPGAIAAAPNGDVYVVSRGNYEQIPSKIVVIDSQTDRVKQIIETPVQQLFVFGDTAWLTHIDYAGNMASRIALLNLRTNRIINDSFITDNTPLQTVYGLYVSRSRKLVFIADAKGFVNTGIVHCFNLQGQKQFSFPTGLNPSKMTEH